MRSFEQRKNPGRLFLRRLGLLALLVLAVLGASGVLGVYRKERESAALRAQAEHMRDDLLARESQLGEELAKLKTDRGLEEQLREQYALAAKGEGLIIIVDPSTTTPIQATSSVRQWLEKTFGWW